MQSKSSSAPPADVEYLTFKLLNRRRINAETGCWEWCGATADGYGHMKVNGQMIRVPRMAAHLWLGFDLTSSLLVCHACDNRLCFNPDHLFAGDGRDNMQDAKRKGRLVRPGGSAAPRGEAHVKAKLTDRDVIELRRLRAAGWTWTTLAENFNITVGTAHMAGTGKTWKHLDGDTVAKPTPGRGRPLKRLVRSKPQ
jgi:hypothetical protein